MLPASASRQSSLHASLCHRKPALLHPPQPLLQQCSFVRCAVVRVLLTQSNLCACSIIFVMRCMLPLQLLRGRRHSAALPTVTHALAPGFQDATPSPTSWQAYFDCRLDNGRRTALRHAPCSKQCPGLLLLPPCPCQCCSVRANCCPVRHACRTTQTTPA